MSTSATRVHACVTLALVSRQDKILCNFSTISCRIERVTSTRSVSLWRTNDASRGETTSGTSRSQRQRRPNSFHQGNHISLQSSRVRLQLGLKSNVCTGITLIKLLALFVEAISRGGVNLFQGHPENYPKSSLCGQRARKLGPMAPEVSPQTENRQKVRDFIITLGVKTCRSQVKTDTCHGSPW